MSVRSQWKWRRRGEVGVVRRVDVWGGLHVRLPCARVCTTLMCATVYACYVPLMCAPVQAGHGVRLSVVYVRVQLPGVCWRSLLWCYLFDL